MTEILPRIPWHCGGLKHDIDAAKPWFSESSLVLICKILLFILYLGPPTRESQTCSSVIFWALKAWCAASLPTTSTATTATSSTRTAICRAPRRDTGIIQNGEFIQRYTPMGGPVCKCIQANTCTYMHLYTYMYMYTFTGEHIHIHVSVVHVHDVHVRDAHVHDVHIRIHTRTYSSYT